MLFTPAESLPKSVREWRTEGLSWSWGDSSRSRGSWTGIGPGLTVQVLLHTELVNELAKLINKVNQICQNTVPQHRPILHRMRNTVQKRYTCERECMQVYFSYKIILSV